MSYRVGKNRIFYTSRTSTGKVVEIDFLSPKLVRSEKMTMIPVDDAFYIDVYLSEQGSYYARVFEDGKERGKEFLVVNDNSSIILYPNENII